jgi:protoporphyrinogen IX oxidase
MFAWVQAFHIISMVCWFAALFSLPRLFVYHAMSDDAISIERFKIMERKLSRGIATPASIATLFFGGWLVALSPQYYFSAGWFHAKMTLVVLLLIYHHMCVYYLKKFRNDANTRSHVFFRWFNEVPVLMLVGIVILVIVKPF